MALQELQSHLQRSFYAPAAQGLDAVFRLSINDEMLTFEIADGQLNFDPHSGKRPDATFYFTDMDVAWALFTGQADAFKAFMEGQFRADGYLMWAFTLMSMFQSASLPDTPVE